MTQFIHISHLYHTEPAASPRAHLPPATINNIFLSTSTPGISSIDCRLLANLLKFWSHFELSQNVWSHVPLDHTPPREWINSCHDLQHSPLFRLPQTSKGGTQRGLHRLPPLDTCLLTQLQVILYTCHQMYTQDINIYTSIQHSFQIIHNTTTIFAYIKI